MRARPIVLLLIVCALVGGFAATQRAAAALPNTNGITGAIPAYYDHNLLTINFMRLTQAQATLLLRNGQHNTIYQSDPGLPGGQPFVSVIDAIPADGMNPLWAEQQIAFTAGHTPHQLFSDNEVLAAAASGEITLTPTNEMYRCSVIGKAVTTGASSIASGVFGVRPAAPAAVGAVPAPAPRSSSWGGIKVAFR